MNNRIIAGLLIVVALVIVGVLIAAFMDAVPLFGYRTETQVLQAVPQGQIAVPQQGQVQGAYTSVSPYYYQAYQDTDGNYRGGQTIYGLPATSPYASTNVTSYPGPGTYYRTYQSQPTQYRYYYQSQPTTQPGGTVVCTADAMQCPDGTYVSRVAPSCQFAACPGR